MTPSSLVEKARALLRQGRLHELVGASPGSSPAELRAACKRAQLRAHPDKGGDPELFVVVREAVERLTPSELPAYFDGPVPEWASRALDGIASMRRALGVWRERLEQGRATLKNTNCCRTGSRRREAQRSVDDCELQIHGLQTAIADEERRYLQRYRQHEDRRREEQEARGAREEREARRAREEQEAEARRAKTLRETKALQKRVRCPAKSRFPTLPTSAQEEVQATLQRLRTSFHRLVDKQRKRKKRRKGERTAEGAEEAAESFDALDEEIQRTLAQARELVRREYNLLSAENSAARGCFPRVPRDDPRAPRLEELKMARQKLLHRARFDERVRQEIRQIEEQASRLLIA